MGHADVRVLRRYQDVLPVLKAQAAKKIGDVLGDP
jgi:hypothetical protein